MQQARRLWITAVLTVAFLPLGWTQEVASIKARDEGPQTIVITYRCAPAKRPAFRKYLQTTFLPRLQQWKTDGILQDYRLVFNRVTDEATYDAMAILSLRDYSQIDRWRDIEITAPGGLTEQGLELAAPAYTYSMDLVWHGQSSPPIARGKTVFFLIPYDYYPHTIEEYIKYANTYVLPQIDGWMKEGILASYGIYLNRYSTSRPWKVLFILEYKDTLSFGARDRTIAKVRAALKDNPAWKSLSDTKQTIRVEKETVVADELLPATP